MREIDIAIVGAGPAGAYCAFELAKNGIHATIFDHSHPREKPCGGGITPKLMENFPYLKKIILEDGNPTDFKIISCTNREIVLKGIKAINVSRLYFDNAILELALENGAKLIKERVNDIRKKQNHWEIETEKSLLSAKILVGADGVNSVVRRRIMGAIPRNNLALTYGYIATGIESKYSIVKYLDAIPGYIWVFPRRNHLSVGIGAELKYGNILREYLDNYLSAYLPEIKVKSRFSSILPSAQDPNFFKSRCSGQDWILLGDAAGHVDPITGEGILYAVWSGKLAAEAIVGKNLRLYDSLWRKQYGVRLMERTNKKDVLYDPLKIELSIILSSFHDSKH